MANPFDILKKEEQKRKQYLALAKNKQYRRAEEVWHRLSQGTYVGDMVYGASDGIVTTFAVVAGAAGAALSPAIVVILGLANLVADGFSMGASKFLSLRSERKFIASQRKREEWEVDHFPEMEREETREIFRRWGLPQNVTEQAADAVVNDKQKWIDLMMKEELHLPEDDRTSAVKHGFITFVAFVVAGAIPLAPFLFSVSANQFFISVILAGAAFFSVGAARTLITSENSWKAGSEILLVGGAAAAVAYCIGWAMKTIFSIAI